MTSRVLLDSNVLLLFLVGTIRRDLISRFKRTAAFTPTDYDLLLELIPADVTFVRHRTS